MSLEDTLITRPDVGFEGNFTFTSAHPDVTVEFVGENGPTTLLLRTPDVNDIDDNNSFSIRADTENLAFVKNQTYTSPIFSLSSDDIYAHKDLHFKSLIPLQSSNEETESGTIGSSENMLGNIFTEKVHIDGFSVFQQNNELYKRNEETGLVSKLSSGQLFKWFSIKDREDVVYLDGDLIIDNSLNITGVLESNVDLSSYIVDNSYIDRVGIGYGSVTNKEYDPTSQYIVINDAWKSVRNNTELFTSRTVVVNGNVFVKGNVDTNPYITEIREAQHSTEDIVLGTNQWSNIQSSLYTEKQVWIDGSIVVAKDIILNYNHTFDSNVPLVQPLDPTYVDTVSIKDNIIVKDHKTLIQNNEFVEISGYDLKLTGSNIFIDGDVNFHFKNAHVLKEIYEHTVIYNSMELMQKRTAFTGQIPIKHGSSHEIGYHITWTATPTNYDIFKIEGDIFMADTLTVKDGGFRIKTNFTLTINPIDNGDDLPGIDNMFEINNAYRMGIISEAIDVKVERMSAKHVKLKVTWATRSDYHEIYYASLNITGIIPSRIGKRMLISPFHKVIEDSSIHSIPSEDQQPYYALMDVNDDQYDVNSSNAYSNLLVGSQHFASIDIEGIHDRSSLVVNRSSVEKEILIAEFWDKHSDSVNTVDINCDGNSCISDHYNKLKQGVIIGQAGVTSIGISETEKTDTILPSVAQLNVTSQNVNRKRVKVDGAYGNVSVIDNNANIIIGNTNQFNDRFNLRTPTVNEYALDVSGHSMFNGSVTVNNNGMIKADFNMRQFIGTLSLTNVMEMYLCWGINKEDSSSLIQNVKMNIMYNICTTGVNPPKIRTEDINIIIDPQNDDVQKPNSLVIWTREGLSSFFYRNLDTVVEREDFNAVKITVTSYNATPADTVSYASVSIVGDNKLQQFSLDNKLDFYGILDVPEVDDIDLILTIGTYDVDLYSIFSITDRYRAYFDTENHSIDTIKLRIEDYKLKIDTNARGIEYSFNIVVYNRRRYFIDNSLKIKVFEIPKMIPLENSTDIYIDEPIIYNKMLYIYDFYNISHMYEWSFIRNYIRFDSRFQISEGTIDIKGYLSGKSKTVEVSVFYINNQGNGYVFIDNSLKIHYNEINPIIPKEYAPVTVSLNGNESIDKDLLEFYDSFDINYIRFSGHDFITDNTITLSTTDIGTTVRINAFYKDHFDTTVDSTLQLVIVE